MKKRKMNSWSPGQHPEVNDAFVIGVCFEGVGSRRSFIITLNRTEKKFRLLFPLIFFLNTHIPAKLLITLQISVPIKNDIKLN